MAAQNEEPETAVRLVRGSVEGREDAVIPGAWVVDRVDEQALAEGRIWPQSRASQLVGHVVGSQPGERTLDLCAAPGGKATMLEGEVVAVEVDEARAAQLAETARRLGATGVRVVVADGRDLPPELEGFDRALVDAPCSGLGVLASRPDLRWRAEPLPELQLELLRAAIARVRPGGTVVYSTCTIGREECEDVVDAVVADGEVEIDASPRRRVAGVPPPLAPGLPADAAARPRDERLLRRRLGLTRRRRCAIAHKTSRDQRPAAYDRGVGWSDWIRDGVEVEPSLYAADFRRLGEQIDDAPRRRAAACSTSTAATGTSSRR